MNEVDSWKRTRQVQTRNGAQSHALCVMTSLKLHKGLALPVLQTKGWKLQTGGDAPKVTQLAPDSTMLLPMPETVSSLWF